MKTQDQSLFGDDVAEVQAAPSPVAAFSITPFWMIILPSVDVTPPSWLPDTVRLPDARVTPLTPTTDNKFPWKVKLPSKVSVPSL